MRPEKLTLSGFAAYTEEQEIDFGGVDLFALAGPTGAGKSTIIDAIGFALYGAVPRFQDLRLVGPAIAAGQLEAKVRLDFSIGGVAYTATRVVRKDGKGRASTKEARLERGEEVLAGDADAVTREIGVLLGLSFAEFCRCVVLPQGAFAAFLHDKAADRQGLLVGLLGAQLYGEIRERAVAAQRTALATADAHERQLAGNLADATPAAVEAAEQRVAAAHTLVDGMATAQPVLASLTEKRADAASRAATERDRAERLTGISLPDGVADLTSGIEAAKKAVEAAEADERVAATALTGVEAGLVAAGDRRLVDAGVAAHEVVEKAQSEHAARTAAAGRAAQTATIAAAAVADALAVATAAQATFEELRHARAAHVLVPSLVVGQPCPVCQQAVAALPDVDEPAEWGPAQAAARTASAALETARAAAAAADAASAAAVALADDAADRLTAARASAGAAGPRSTLDAARLAIDAAEAAVREASDADRAARARATAARKRLDDSARAEARARQGFDGARDRVADLLPPPAGRVDLGADWSALVAWAASEGPARSSAAEAAEAEARLAEHESTALLAALRQRLVEAGVAVGATQAPTEAAAAELATAAERHRQLAARLAEAETLRAEHAAAAEGAEVARALATHLKADRFEKWLLDEAFGELLAGATVLLRELSGGAYSLELDAKREFSVIDHRNADERRPIRTLSGGETFLASLALALSLADKVVALAPGQVRLESLFLDEGFGTLDPATLDTVAGAIEHLGSAGRMIGIVTHVRELAERLPVRYDVRRGAKGATVEKVLQ